MMPRSTIPIIVVVFFLLPASLLAESGGEAHTFDGAARCLYDVYDGIYASLFLRYDLGLAFSPWFRFTGGGEIDVSRQSLKSVQIGYRVSLVRFADIDVSYVKRWFRPYGVQEDHASLTVEPSLRFQQPRAVHRVGAVVGINGTRASDFRTETSEESYVEFSAFPVWQVSFQSRISSFLGRIEFGNYDRMQPQSRNYWQLRLTANWSPTSRFSVLGEVGTACAGPVPGAGDPNRRWFGIGGSYALR